jgi:acyl-CoA thioester hydrolase
MEAALIETYRTKVLPEWIDYNGHMNVAYYTLVFDRGTDGLLDRLDLGADYRHRSNRTIYVAEAHLTYLREVRAGDEVVVRTHLVGADGKRLHVYHRLVHAKEGYAAASTELMCLHVDLAGPRVAPFGAASAALVTELLAGQRGLPIPEELGRAIRRLGSAQ